MISFDILNFLFDIRYFIMNLSIKNIFFLALMGAGVRVAEKPKAHLCIKIRVRSEAK